jgi:hypothetical protein
MPRAFDAEPFPATTLTVASPPSFISISVILGRFDDATAADGHYSLSTAWPVIRIIFAAAPHFESVSTNANTLSIFVI